MRNQWKKLISACLVLVMVICLLPVTAFAADWFPTSGWDIGDGLHWQLSGTTLHIIKDGWGGNKMIFQTPNTTTATAGPWYQSADTITEILIDDGVTNIAEGAFANMPNPTKVTIPNSMTEIGTGAFANCSKLTSITIPANTTRIGESAFGACTALTNVELSEGLQTIEMAAFHGCTASTAVTLPSTVKTVGEGAFASCRALSSAEFLGTAPTSFGAGVFEDCAADFTIYYGDNKDGWSTPTWKSPAGDVYNAVGPDTHIHDYKVTDQKTATCTEAGYAVYACDCGDTYTENTEALGHDFEDVTTPPTHLEPGYITHTCKRCGYSYVDDTVILPEGHDYHVTDHKAPTATEDGYDVYTCSVCGDSYTVVLPATGGEDREMWVEFMYANYGDYRRADEIFLMAGPEYQTFLVLCDSLNPELIPEQCTYVSSNPAAVGVSNFDMENFEEDDPMMGLFAGCLWGRAEGTSIVTITDPDGNSASIKVTVVPYHEHVFEDFSQAATCTEWGYTGTTTMGCGICSCDYGERSPVEPLGHDHQLSGHKDPTATEDGYDEYTCTRCDDSYVEKIPATGPQECPSKNFVDVPGESNWAHAGIDYVVSKGLMNGIDATHFAPADDVTRAMLVTILWANEGKPAVTTDKKFSDVPANKWYAGAVAWAAENGIVSGRSATTFAPDDAVTRQDLALILKKYAEFKGISGAAAGSLDAFADKGSVSKYAQNAVAWAVANGIISGSNEGGKLYLNPADSATRGQTAAILMKFFENVK